MSSDTQASQQRRASQWVRTRERGSYLGMRILVLLYRYGGNLLLTPALYGVVLYFFLTRRATRRYSRLYLQRATPGRAGLWPVWRHHLAFGRALMARVRAWLGKLPREQVDFPQRQTLWNMKKQGQGVIFLGAHFGNLDMCRTIVQPGDSYTLNIIVNTRHAQKFNRLLQQLNPDSHVNLVQVDQMTPQTAMMLRTKLDDGEAVVLLADRVPEGTESRHYTADFLGEDAHFPQGPFWLSTLLQAPVFFMTSVDTGRGYQLVVEPLLEQPQHVGRRQRTELALALFRRYAAQLEQLCRQYPLQWFNFYDFWLDDLRREIRSNEKQ